ncbi:hypothetical protein SDC9_192432 [bioreactor metagenome]|uniref:Uncharacterized protein n=1 Tax=bioreactor metagenome TaxID=1076179 RepID=A0A645I0Q7_9ZZZZ
MGAGHANANHQPQPTNARHDRQVPTGDGLAQIRAFRCHIREKFRCHLVEHRNRARRADWVSAKSRRVGAG